MTETETRELLHKAGASDEMITPEGLMVVAAICDAIIRKCAQSIAKRIVEQYLPEARVRG